MAGRIGKVFHLYDVIWTAVKALPEDKRLEVIEAIARLVFENKMPEDENSLAYSFAVFYGSYQEHLRNSYEKEKKERCKADRNSSEMRKWRKAVFERDNYTCQLCGAYGPDVELHAHHIQSFKDNEDLRFVVENGSTLCKDCHIGIHQDLKARDKLLKNNDSQVK